jgi:hypothetical protein
MSRAQRYEVEFVDGRVEAVVCDGRDYLFYEETSGESALDLIASSTKMSTWYVSAYAAMSRQGMFSGTPEEFREQVAFVLPTKDSVDPTQPDTPKEDSEN